MSVLLKIRQQISDCIKKTGVRPEYITLPVQEKLEAINEASRGEYSFEFDGTEIIETICGYRIKSAEPETKGSWDIRDFNEDSMTLKRV